VRFSHELCEIVRFSHNLRERDGDQGREKRGKIKRGSEPVRKARRSFHAPSKNFSYVERLGRFGGQGLRRHGEAPAEREFFDDNLLVRIHSIIEIISVDRPCAMDVRIPFFTSTFLG
jgi:hypothetical protein